MKIKLWSLFAVLCLVLCVSCSSDEPQVDENAGSLTGTNDEFIKMSDLVDGEWTDTCYYAENPSSYEIIEVKFERQDDLNGCGTMTIFGGSGDVITKSDQYDINFRIEGDNVVCMATKLDSKAVGLTCNIVLEYKCGQLHLESSDFLPFILSIRKTIQTTVKDTIKMSNLTNGTWSGKYYYSHILYKKEYETIDVKFEQISNRNGIGTLTISGKKIDKDTSKSETYNLNFSINGDKLLCKAKRQGATMEESNINILMEHKDGCLYLEAANMPPFIISNQGTVSSDVRGVFYIAPNATIRKVWFHENGMNILDFRKDGDEAIIQLVEPGSTEYNYYDTLWMGPLYDYNYDDSELVFSGYKGSKYWYICELTYDKMILQGRWDNFKDVYYVASEDILPEPPKPYYDPYQPLHGQIFYVTAPWGVGGNSRR